MSWEQLADVLALNRLEIAENEARPPVACPNDGTPLQTGPAGELFCPFDGWRPDDW